MYLHILSIFYSISVTHRNYKLQHTYIFLFLASCDLTEEARRSEMKSRSRSQNPPSARVVNLHPQLREQSLAATTLRQRWETTEKTGRQSRVDTKMRPTGAPISKAVVAVKDTTELPRHPNPSQNVCDVDGVSVDNRVPALARPKAGDVRHQTLTTSDCLQKITERVLPQDESCYLSNNSAPALKLSLFTKKFPEIDSEQRTVIGGHLGKESRKTGSSPSQLMQPGGGPCWFRPSNSPEVRKRSSRSVDILKGTAQPKVPRQLRVARSGTTAPDIK
jgi:hypothetical protein